MRQQRSTLVFTAMICAGAVTAQFVAGKAARDALYLAHLDVTSLPVMVIVTSIFAILLVVITSRTLRAVSPTTFVPIAFAASAALLVAEWGLIHTFPRVGAAAVYLQISGVGPMLGSGFWLIASECFDPHTAKKHFGQIAGVGTLGGLLGALFAERVGGVLGVSAVLPALAGMNLFCAWQIRQLARSLPPPARSRVSDLAPDLGQQSTRSGLRVLRDAPYLRNLAVLVFLGTVGASLVDYIFKFQAVSTFGRGESLLRFFALYYAAITLITFVIQTSSSRIALEKLGLATTTGTPSLALMFTGIGGLIVPGLPSAMVARGGESVFRGSLFRSGYELLYTAIPVAEKRAAKSIIDVGVDRLGDAVGAGIVRVLLLVLPPARQSPAILASAVLCSLVALAVASRMSRGYIQTLERNLLSRAVELDPSDVTDMTTRSVVFNSMTLAGFARPRTTRAGASGDQDADLVRTQVSDASASKDTEIQQIVALRSRDPQRILAVLQNEEGIPPSLVAHVIPLLAWEPVAQSAKRALRKVAEGRVGELTDALVDPKQPFVIRRRLPDVFAVCGSQRAADGLVLGLDDMRFEVRFHCARALTQVRDRNPRIKVDEARIFEVVEREAAVGRSVWDSDRLLQQSDDAAPNMFLDDFVKDRASRSMAHVFTLLALVLPTEPLKIAFQGLHTDDQHLRGTALEYLGGVLPRPIRARLWPYLEDQGAPSPAARPREQILADLVRSHQSILLNLEELKQRAKSAEAAAAKSAGRADELARS
jgi:ATP/ADP translocase